MKRKETTDKMKDRIQTIMQRIVQVSRNQSRVTTIERDDRDSHYFVIVAAGSSLLLSIIGKPFSSCSTGNRCL